MSDTIQCLEHHGWFEITLNRPDQLNSFTDEMHLALRACLQKAQNNSARAVLLTGAGAYIALACDIVLAAQSAKFVQSFSKVGLIPDTGGSWHLPHLLGEVRAQGTGFYRRTPKR